MTRSWVIADTHFGHWGVCKFTRSDGVTPLRPWDNPTDMDTAIIRNWNELVRPEDRVYILGDLCINRKAIQTVGRCNGRKVLVKGNHDIFKLKDYLPFFDDIRAYVTSPKQYIMSHIPISEASLGRWQINIHGHTHSNSVLDKFGNPDSRYVCVSVEQTEFKPVELTELLNRCLTKDV